MNVVWRAAEIIKQIGEITYYNSVVLDDVEYAVKDGVYMWSGKDDSPYIGQISKKIHNNNNLIHKSYCKLFSCVEII